MWGQPTYSNLIRVISKYGRLIVVLVVIVGIALISVIVSDRKTPVISCKDCNVIVVGYDTVGAKHVSSLGYERDTTPQLDKMAKAGFSFAQNYSTAPWTVPSFMATFTGQYPTQHGVVNKYTVYNSDQQTISNLDQISPGTETLAQQFKKQGYMTGGFTGDSGVSAKFGYGNGFDVYTEPTPFGSIGDSSTQAISWLKENPNKKFFMFLHGYDAHGQNKVDDDFLKTGEFIPKSYKGPLTGTAQEEAMLREKQLTEDLNLTKEDYAYLNGIYDSKIKNGDAKFGKFWSQIESMGLAKKTVVVMLADHGEEWGEHNGVDHGHSLYGEQVHVPLVFTVPGAEPLKEPIDTQVSSLDVAPTLFDIVGLKPTYQYESQMQGKSLLPLMQGKGVAGQDVFLETDYLDFTHIRGIQTANGWKYIITEQTGKEELYDLNNDPGEHKNVAKVQANKAKLQELRLRVRNHIIAMGDNPDKQWTTGCLPVYPSECQQ